MLLISIYIVLVISITFFQWKKVKGSIFKSNQKVTWWISGLSLYMLYLSVDQGQLISGIISEHGMQGMWMVWAGNLGVFVVPLVFAPLWHKLNLSTDNQFILFRFPGKAGAWLHRFRAIYVGGLVVTLAVSFHLIGFARVIQVFYGLSPFQSTCIGGGIMLLFAIKNVFDIKLKLDVLHTILFIISFFAVVFFVGKAFIFEKDWMKFLVDHPAKRSLFPTDSSAWFSMFIYLGVQWWSCYLFDGGGAETSRFTAVKTPKDAIKAGLTPILISFLLSFFMVIHVVALLGYSKHSMPGELAYVSSLFNLLPSYSKDIVFLGFFAMFITTAESLLNWGASFLVIDAWNGWLNPNKKQKEHRAFSIVMMLALSLLSVLVALNVSNLLDLIKITFSISAGVAPLFILRWIWFRINAWSQLTAMLSSGVFTLAYPYLHENSPLRQFPLEESRILVVTILTTLTWITVTLISSNQTKTVEEKLLPIIGSRKQLIYRLSMAILLGITLTYCTYIIWQIILGS
jgi:Na+/proline symporter